MAIRQVNGHTPETYILNLADGQGGKHETLDKFMGREMRTRYTNPEWVKAMLKEGYGGARFIMKVTEHLWGWQVTRPDLVKNWAWDEVKAVYFDDAQKLGLPKFLGQGHNAHVKAQMLAIFMVAAEKGFWKTNAATIKQMGGELARLVAKNGLPGSGHTAPHHRRRRRRSTPRSSSIRTGR